MPPTATTPKTARTTSTPSTMMTKAIKGIGHATQGIDRMSDNMRRGESTKRGTRWRGRRAKSICTDNLYISVELANAGPVERTPRARRLLLARASGADYRLKQRL